MIRIQTVIFAILLPVGLLAACDQSGSNTDGVGGGGADAAPVGSGGSGGTRVSAGGAGGGGAGGEGGTAGVVGLDWLDADDIWRDLSASSGEAQIRVRESLPGGLRFPPVKWVECGPGCETTTFEGNEEGMFSSGAMDVVVTPDGQRVMIAFNQPRPSYWIRRFVDLRSGASTHVLRLDPTRPVPAGQMPPLAISAGKSPNLTTMFSNEMMLYTMYDARTGSWEFKLPWAEAVGNACEKWAVDSTPPALFFGCMNVSMLTSDDSNEKTGIAESENYGSGAGNAGLSVWSEIFPGPQSTSRIRTWSPDVGTRLAVESMPGIACGLAVSEDRIVGVRSGDASQATICYQMLRAPAFWSVRREGGAVTSWSIPGVEEAAPSRSTAWGDFAAAQVLTGSSDLPQAERSQLWLLRLSDGRMRRLVPTPGHEWRGRLLALDDTHLYIGENLANRSRTIDRISRYRLDRFDEIGVPLE